MVGPRTRVTGDSITIGQPADDVCEDAAGWSNPLAALSPQSSNQPGTRTGGNVRGARPIKRDPTKRRSTRTPGIAGTRSRRRARMKKPRTLPGFMSRDGIAPHLKNCGDRIRTCDRRFRIKTDRFLRVVAQTSSWHWLCTTATPQTNNANGRLATGIHVRQNTAAAICRCSFVAAIRRGRYHFALAAQRRGTRLAV